MRSRIGFFELTEAQKRDRGLQAGVRRKGGSAATFFHGIVIEIAVALRTLAL